MKPNTEASLLRIFIGESDQHGHISMSEAIVREARNSGIAGATAFRGILSYGASTHIRSSKILDLSSDLPIIVEIADTEDKVNGFIKVVDQMFEESGCGGLITIEKVQILRYCHGTQQI